MVMDYIGVGHPGTLGLIDIESWTGGRVTDPAIAGHETYVYASEGWKMTLDWDVVAPEYLVYRIVSEHENGIIWKGEVKGDEVVEKEYRQAQDSKDVVTISELLTDPIYNQEVSIFGEISLLGELFCSCFELTSNGERVLVWYDSMVDDDGNERPRVSVDLFENGDWVIVTGELQMREQGKDLNDFWTSTIMMSSPSGKPLTEEISLEIGLNYILNSPTFLFDGQDQSILHEETRYLRCPYCWQFVFTFSSLHAGYGDRSGQQLAQVITSHEVLITVAKGKIIQATMDQQWDMIKQEFL
jgi:hypothetical protein